MTSTKRSIFAQFFSGTLVIGLARFSSILFGLVSLAITVRAVSAKEYGEYILIFVAISFLVEFTSFGLSMTIPQYMASNEDASFKHILINTVLLFRVFILLIVVLLALLSMPLVNHFYGNTIAPEFFAYLPLLFAFASLSHLFRSILRGQFSFTMIGLIEFVSNAVELLSIITFVVFLKLGLHGLLLAKLASGAIAILLALRAVQVEYGFTFDLVMLKKMLKFSLPLQLQYIFGFIFSRIDTFIVASILGAGGVAYYEVARKIPDTLMELYSVFISVYFPISAHLYANEEKERTEILINNSVRVLTFIAAFGALITVIFGRDIISLFFSDKYLASYFTFVLLMIGLTAQFLEETLGYSLIAIGDPVKPLIVNIVRALVSMTGNLTLLPLMGFSGAAVVSVVSNVVAIPLDAFFLWKRNLNIRYVEYFKPLLLFVLLSGVFVFFTPTLFWLKTVIAILYFPLCIAFSVITLADLSRLHKETSLRLSKFFRKPRLNDGWL